jgi:hypothetical protein
MLLFLINAFSKNENKHLFSSISTKQFYYYKVLLCSSEHWLDRIRKEKAVVSLNEPMNVLSYRKSRKNVVNEKSKEKDI